MSKCNYDCTAIAQMRRSEIDQLTGKLHVIGAIPARSTTLMMRYYACKFPKEEFFDIMFMQ